MAAAWLPGQAAGRPLAAQLHAPRPVCTLIRFCSATIIVTPAFNLPLVMMATTTLHTARRGCCRVCRSAAPGLAPLTLVDPSLTGAPATASPTLASRTWSSTRWRSGAGGSLRGTALQGGEGWAQRGGSRSRGQQRGNSLPQAHSRPRPTCRCFTADESSGVPASRRGTYLGVADKVGAWRALGDLPACLPGPAAAGTPPPPRARLPRTPMHTLP